MCKPHLWVRAETKAQEERTALPPFGVKKLTEHGFRVTIEDCSQNAFKPDEYKSLGATMVPAGSWQSAPKGTFILGLKDLPESNSPLVHKHIFFGHAYKGQQGSADLLARFQAGGGTLLDLEYLTDDTGRRIAAFGYWAGFAGAAIAVKAWANITSGTHTALGPLKSLKSKNILLDQLHKSLQPSAQRPRIHVIGAKGRTGAGALAVAAELGLETIEWDLEETKKGGPFEALNDADVLVNCVLVNRKIRPFITINSLSKRNRKLSVIADVSCDPTSACNPLPIYHEGTSFEKPCKQINVPGKPLNLIAIDHLPSLLPRESSIDFCNQLLPHLLALEEADNPIWKRAENLFNQCVKESGATK